MSGLIRRLTYTVTSLVAFIGMGVMGAPNASAYGSSDNPLAQVELSANCNDPSFPLCQEVGLGGIWLWVEIDADGGADVAGAGCGHEPGVGGGAGGIRGDFHWTSFSGTPQQFAAAYPEGFLAGVDPGGHYYVLDGLGFGFPVTQGHYSLHPVPAVTIQLQVAP